MKQITPSELRTLKLIAQGHGAKEAAKIAGISPWTAKCQIHSATKKLGARNAPHVVAIAMAHGWIKPEDLQ